MRVPSLSSPALLACLPGVFAIYGCGKAHPDTVGVVQQKLTVSTTFNIPVEADLFRTVLLGENSTQLGAHATVSLCGSDAAAPPCGKGFVVAGNNGASGTNFLLGSGPVSLLSLGSVTLLANASISGEIVAGGTITEHGPVVVSGGTTEHALFAAPRVYTVATDVGTPAGELHLGANQSATLAPGSYLTLDMQPHSTLNLSAGQYYWSSVHVKQGATINIDDSSGTALILVSRDLVLDGNITVKRAPESVGIVYTGTAPALIGGNFVGSVLAPSATVDIETQTTAKGSFFAADLTVDPNATIQLSTFEGWGPLLCGTAPARTLEQARRLPASCTTPHLCCPSGSIPVNLADTGVRYDVTTTNACVFGGSGDDVITGCRMAGSVIQGSAGNDNISVGEGTVVYGGPGDDVLESFGNSVIFGNDGDDVISAAAGNNVISPGAGKDIIHTGSGDDVVLLNDECEIVAGEVISLGAGHDIVISPLDRAALEARGVTLIDVEEVQVERHSCKSECRNPPKCSGVGTCVEAATAGGALTCDCPPITQGAQCENSNPPPFVPSVPPSLHTVPSGGETQAAIDFTDWYYRSAIGDGDSARAELRAARANPPLRDAFVATTRKLVDGPNYQLAAAGLDMVAFLQCQGCEQLLRDVLGRPIPSAGLPTNLEHGVRPGTTDEFAELAIQRTAINGLAFQMTRASKSFLLTQMSVARSDLRRSIAHALIAAYGDSIRSDVLARLLPEEKAEAYRFPNYSTNFSALFAQFVAATK